MSAPVSQRTDLAPLTAEGWARLRARLEADGALTALEKAVIIVAVAAVRGRDALIGREIARLERLGGADAVFSCASFLTVARGREVADRLAATAEVTLDWDVAAPAPADDEEAQRAREYFVPTGDAPPPFALLAEHAPDVLVGYRQLRGGIFEQGALEPRLVELALFAISAADFQHGHAAVHGAKAIDAGAGTAELVEAGLCAIPSAGMGSWLYSASVIDELEEKGQK